MLDIKFIRDNQELVKEAAKRKGVSVDIDRLLNLDSERRVLVASIEKRRADQNIVGGQITNEKDEVRRRQLIEEMKSLKHELHTEEEKLKPILQEWQTLMLVVPNVPDISVPDGTSDEDNQEIRTSGEPPEFPFSPKNHISLLENLQLADFDKGAEVAGFRGYFLKGEAVRLTFALWQFALNHFVQVKKFSPLLVPSLVRKETLFGTGYLPQGKDDLYITQDEMYFAGTGEVGTMAYFSERILDVRELPVKIIAFSPCFRREAGSYGKDTKGLMRVHEFFKLEQVIICEASHEESVRWHETINANMEDLLGLLKLPYRVVVNCAGDLGLGQVKKYDIELWIPSEKKYREISSASYFHDFQTRRMNIRYRDADGKLRFAHSLNSTALPTPRILIALVENYQRADGTIEIPDVLRPFMGKDLLTTE